MSFLTLWKESATEGPLKSELRGCTGADICDFVQRTANSGEPDKSPAAVLMHATCAHVLETAEQAQTDVELQLRTHINKHACAAPLRAIPNISKLQLTDEQFETVVGMRYWPKKLPHGKAHLRDCPGASGDKRSCQSNQTALHPLKCTLTAGYGITERHDGIVSELVRLVKQAGARWARSTGSLHGRNITIAQQPFKRPWDLLLMSPNGEQIAIDVGVACDEDPKTGVLKQLEAMAGKTGKQRERARQEVSGVNNARAIERKKSKAKTKVPPPESVRQPTFDAQGKCTNPLTVAEHAKHVENTRFIPFILESSGVYGKQASQFVQEVSKWAQSQGIRPDHFEENMRRCIGMSLMKSNCDLMSRAAYVQGTLRGNRWTRANTRQRTATAMMMQFDIDTQIPHAGVAHR